MWNEVCFVRVGVKNLQDGRSLAVE
uniref:Uncharacterized protein n=1 Tax=Anguilla anguilla TaxID=7936 RepID=A0A0E9SS20_ANGAN